jgi:hypothetical protein
VCGGGREEESDVVRLCDGLKINKHWSCDLLRVRANDLELG